MVTVYHRDKTQIKSAKEATGRAGPERGPHAVLLSAPPTGPRCRPPPMCDTARRAAHLSLWSSEFLLGWVTALWLTSSLQPLLKLLDVVITFSGDWNVPLLPAPRPHPHHIVRLSWAPGRAQIQLSGRTFQRPGGVHPLPHELRARARLFLWIRLFLSTQCYHQKFKQGWFLGGGIAVDFVLILGTVLCCLNFFQYEYIIYLKVK